MQSKKVDSGPTKTKSLPQNVALNSLGVFLHLLLSPPCSLNRPCELQLAPASLQHMGVVVFIRSAILFCCFAAVQRECSGLPTPIGLL